MNIVQIEESELFKKQLKTIVTYIAEDKKSSVISFMVALKKEVNLLIEFPYMFKVSNYYDESFIRDMTFKRYSIIYEIDEDNNKIVLLEIFNKNLPVLQ